MDKFKVTFYNALAGRRGLLVDNVTEEQANAVVVLVSDKNDAFFYLPEARKEPQRAESE